jgi:hypothetical protein
MRAGGPSHASSSRRERLGCKKIVVTDATLTREKGDEWKAQYLRDGGVLIA